jgi:hypothetical protein
MGLTLGLKMSDELLMAVNAEADKSRKAAEQKEEEK